MLFDAITFFFTLIYMLPSDFCEQEYREIHPYLESITTVNELRYHYLTIGKATKRPYRWSAILPIDFNEEKYRQKHGLEILTSVEIRHHYFQQEDTPVFHFENHFPKENSLCE